MKPGSSLPRQEKQIKTVDRFIVRAVLSATLQRRWLKLQTGEAFHLRREWPILFRNWWDSDLLHSDQSQMDTLSTGGESAIVSQLATALSFILVRSDCFIGSVNSIAGYLFLSPGFGPQNEWTRSDSASHHAVMRANWKLPSCAQPIVNLSRSLRLD